jgi:DNA-binding NarL/FixJ family response regulator
MNNSDHDPVTILVVVDGASFGAAVLQVLQNCAPFPLNAALTTSLSKALMFLRENPVEVVLLDAKFLEKGDVQSIELLRSFSSVPAIVFARSLTPELEERLMKLGAQAVLAREVINPIILVKTVETVVEKYCFRKSLRPPAGGGQAMTDHNRSRRIVVTDGSDVFKRRAGASRLLKFLNQKDMPSQPQLERLRKLLNKSRPELP